MLGAVRGSKNRPHYGGFEMRNLSRRGLPARSEQSVRFLKSLEAYPSQHSTETRRVTVGIATAEVYHVVPPALDVSARVGGLWLGLLFG